MIRIVPYKGRDDAWLVDIRVRLPSGVMHRERYRSPARTLTATRTWADRREGEILSKGPRPQASDAPTLEKFSKRWIDEHAKANQQKASTVYTKKLLLEKHILPELGKMRLDEIDSAAVQKLKASLGSKIIRGRDRKPTKFSEKSISNILSILSGMLKSAIEWHELESAPHIKLVRYAKKTMDFFEPDEYSKLVAGAAKCSPQDLALILLAGDAGLRRGELVALEHRDIDVRRGFLIVERSQWKGITGKPKGGRSRRVPLSPELAKALRQIPGIGSARVLTRRGGKTLTPKACEVALRRAQSAAGIPLVGGVHKLRHTFGSHLAMAGVPILAIKELMGHSSIQTTQGYMHLSPSSDSESIAALARLHSKTRGTTGAPSSESVTNH